MSQLNLVLDWDLTLAFSIPSTDVIFYKNGLLRTHQSDAVIGCDRNGVATGTQVYLRPGFERFLETMATQYNLVLWSYGVEAYIEECLTVVDVKHRFQKVLTRADHAQGLPIKDLATLGYPLNEVVIVDDRNAVFGVLNPLNCIPIRPWDGIDMFDDQLDGLPARIEEKFAFLATKDPHELQGLRVELLRQVQE